MELFDIAQSNSEHSRHWFFKGKLVVDGVGVEETLMGIVKDTLDANPNNSVIGFNDNSRHSPDIENPKTLKTQNPKSWTLSTIIQLNQSFHEQVCPSIQNPQFENPQTFNSIPSTTPLSKESHTLTPKP